MGMIYLNAISSYDFDQSGPAGRFPGRMVGTITEILVDPKRDPAEDGGIRYGKEIDCTLGAIDYRIPYRRKYGSGSMPKEEGRFRVEAQIPKSVLESEESPITSGWEAILSRRADAKWVQRALFKNPNNDGDDSLLELDEPVEDFKEILDRIDRLNVDPWETGKYLTSGIFVPPRLFDDDVRNYSRGEWYLSACNEFDRFVELLLECDRSKELRRLTDNGTLAIGNAKADSEKKKLHPNTIPEGNSLLHLSIRQALAGVDRDENDSSDIVMDRVEKLYRNHMYLKNSKIIDDLKKHTELKDQ